MTPEQIKNYWILEGYPLMPEWIEFCRRIRKYRERDEYAQDANASVNEWWGHVARQYKEARHLSTRAYFATVDEELAFKIGTDVIYKWNLGEDHAVE